jgi:hypothetical protein
MMLRTAGTPTLLSRRAIQAASPRTSDSGSCASSSRITFMPRAHHGCADGSLRRCTDLMSPNMSDRSLTTKYPDIETTEPNTPGFCIAMFIAP